MPVDGLIAGGSGLGAVVAVVGEVGGEGVGEGDRGVGSAVGGWGGVEYRLCHGARFTKREQESDHCQAAVGVGVDHVKLGGEALTIHQVLRGRVKVRRLQLEFPSPEHGSVARGVVHVDLPAVVAEGCLGGGVREGDGAGAANW